MSGRGTRRGNVLRGGAASPTVRGRVSSGRGGGTESLFSPMSAFLQPTPVGQYKRSSSADVLQARMLTPLVPLAYNIPVVRNRYDLPAARGPISLKENKRPGGLRHAKTPSELLSVSVCSVLLINFSFVFNLFVVLIEPMCQGYIDVANQAHPGALFQDMATLQNDSAEPPAVMSGTVLVIVFELFVTNPMHSFGCI